MSKPCRFFGTGTCTKGDACPFPHTTGKNVKGGKGGKSNEGVKGGKGGKSNEGVKGNEGINDSVLTCFAVPIEVYLNARTTKVVPTTEQRFNQGDFDFCGGTTTNASCTSSSTEIKKNPDIWDF